MRLLRKTVGKGELRNIDVDLVSLCFDNWLPKNGKDYVVKADDGNRYRYLASSVKTKAVATEGRVYVTVMEPGTKDKDGDFCTEQEIVKACNEFAQKGMVLKNDVNHDMHAVPDFFVAENYILKAADRDHFPDTKLGSWVQTLQCTNLEGDLWKKVEKGQFNGVSIYGRADEVVHETDTRKQMEALKAQIANLEANASDPTVKQSLEKMKTELETVTKAASNTIAQEALDRIDSGIRTLDRTLSKAISTSLRGEPTESIPADREVMIDGQKIVVKASHIDLYKAIASLDAGQPMNILNETTSSLIIDTVVTTDPGDTLTEITVMPLIKDEKIDKGLLDDLILTPEGSTITEQEVITGDIACPTTPLNAHFSLKQSTIEFYKDKYGEEAFGAYVENGIAAKTREALSRLLFMGNTASATAALKGLDGIVTLATSASKVTSLSQATYSTWDDRLEQALLGFDNKVLAKNEGGNNFRIYLPFRDLIKLRSELGKRETNEGDRLLLTGGAITFAGIPIKGRLLDDGYLAVGLPKFAIIGYRTDATMKVEHHGSDWKYHWYIRLRAGITYLDDFFKIYHQTA